MRSGRPSKQAGFGARFLIALAGLLGLSTNALGQAPVTFSKDVAPILYEHCAACHRPGEIAPFSLLTYEDARPQARALARATRDRTMPPWKPEPGFGEFSGADRLTERQIETIQRWADGGAVQGDPSTLPPAPRFAQGWRLGQPDLVVTLADPYVLAAGGPDVLRNFVIPIPGRTMKYVRGIEFRPGNTRVVHHANMRIDPTSASRMLDDAEAGPGFNGLLVSGNFPDGHFLGWTPGQLPPLLPDGMSWRLEANSDLVLQLHMHPGSSPETVQPSVGFFFTNTPPARTPLMLRLGRQNIDIPAGATSYIVEDHYRLPVDVQVFGVQPHAHYRAREIKGVATLPDGTTKWLIFIKDWDFNWQDVYRYREPLALPKGTTVSMQYTYDNSAANRRNPDHPPQHIRWGQNSVDEMGDLWIQVVTASAADRHVLEADFGPKVLAEDATGYEKLLEGDPRNARLHDAAAALFLSLHQNDRALAHLNAALTLDPGLVSAHYNIATALLALNDPEAAIGHLRRAVELQPDFAAAHVNLGTALRQVQRYDESERELRRGLQLQPNSGAAHTNLGGVLLAERRGAEAIAEYRLALGINPDLLEPMASLAWVLATSSDARLRRPGEAVQLAERAATRTSRGDVTILDTLAAAYASAGRYAEAVATESTALEIVEKAGATSAAEPIRARLDLYKKKRPFVDGK
jgi:tetratricopeptide (TPR) repeat protein/mono/diheme cytochrome c family protein